MATEFSLVTCLGLGTTVTLTATSPTVVTLTAHGMPNGHKVRFVNNTAYGGASDTITVGGSQAHDTLYYVKSLGANTFNLCTDVGLTSTVNVSAQSGTHKLIGDYYYSLPVSSGNNYRSRYGGASGYVNGRVYASHVALINVLNTAGNKSISKDVVCEYQGKWTDLGGSSSTQVQGYKSITLWSKINGVRDQDAFHYGKVGGGYACVFNNQYQSGIDFNQPAGTVDGLEFRNTNALTNYSAVGTTTLGCVLTVKNCILQGGYGAKPSQSSNLIVNNIFIDCVVAGFYNGSADANNSIIAFNIAHNCAVGFKDITTQYRYMADLFVGNIAIGNTINWSKPNGTVEAGSRFYGAYNFGEVADLNTVTFTNATNLVNLTAHGFAVNTPIRFINGGGATAPAGLSFGTVYYTRTVSNANAFTLTTTPAGGADIDFTTDGSGTIQISRVWDNTNTIGYVSSTDFVDYANHDFRPASASSPQVELITLVDGDGLPRYDMTDAVRPNYINNTTDKADAGPFEFDHGNGIVPLSATLTLTGLQTGTEVHVYKSSDLSELAATEGTAGSTFTYNYTWTGDVTVYITILKEGFQWIRMDGQVLSSTGVIIPVFQAIDRTFNNPV